MSNKIDFFLSRSVGFRWYCRKKLTSRLIALLFALILIKQIRLFCIQKVGCFLCQLMKKLSNFSSLLPN